MKKILFIGSFFISLNCFAQFSLKDFTALHGLTGSWKLQKKKGMIVEEWKLQDDSTMTGYSYLKTASDSIIPQENVQLTFRNGSIVYSPVTAGQNNEAPVPFTLTEIKEGEYFFENKAHDFPTLITYHLLDNRTLNASISGMINGEQKEIRYNFTRQP
jgi:hypothetical protein